MNNLGPADDTKPAKTDIIKNGDSPNPLPEELKVRITSKDIEPIKVEGFEIYEQLGMGGMGAVYRALDLSSGQIVALKVLFPHMARDQMFIKRFLAEAESAQRLDHPNIVKVFHCGVSGETRYIAMEYVDGDNMRALIKQQNGVLHEATTAAIGMCVASALYYAWEKERLIHRDIKPENLLIRSDGAVKLCDLGIAKRMVPDATNLTRTGMRLGSPHYMAPEQVKGSKDIDFRVDVFALGATLYHAVTGHTLHDAENEFSLILMQAAGEIKNPRELNPNISERFATLLMRMLKIDRNFRQGDWETVFLELETIYNEAKEA